MLGNLKIFIISTDWSFPVRIRILIVQIKTQKHLVKDRTVFNSLLYEAESSLSVNNREDSG